MQTELYLIGAGGLGRELLSILQHVELAALYHVIGFIDDAQPVGTSINGVAVVGNVEWLKTQATPNVVLAIGVPSVRHIILSKLADTHTQFPTIVHPEARLYDSRRIKLGKGVFIGEGCILTTDIAIDDFSLIHLGCSLHHDTKIGRNCVLMPGVRITGGATILDEQRLEAGTCITGAITIG